MILGTGIDLVEIGRIRESHAKFGELFLKRVLLPEESAYCLQHRDPVPHIAARFAAKEAVAKAFGTGIGAELGWHDMEIGRDGNGRPFVTLRGAGLELMRRRGVESIHLSLTHTKTHAAAVAILEGR